MAIEREKFGKSYVLVFNELYSNILQILSSKLIALSIRIKPISSSYENVDIREMTWSIAKTILDKIHNDLDKEYYSPNFKDQEFTPVATLFFLDIFSHTMCKFIPEYAYRQIISHVLSELHRDYPDIYNLLEDIRQATISQHDSNNLPMDLACFMSRIIVDITTTTYYSIEAILGDNETYFTTYSIDAYTGLKELFQKALSYTKNNLMIN